MRDYVVKANVEPYEFLLSLDVAYEIEGIPEDGCHKYIIIAPDGVGDDVIDEFFPEYFDYSDVYAELYVDNLKLARQICCYMGNDKPYEFDDPFDDIAE